MLLSGFDTGNTTGAALRETPVRPLWQAKTIAIGVAGGVIGKIGEISAVCARRPPIRFGDQPPGYSLVSSLRARGCGHRTRVLLYRRGGVG